MSKKLYERAIKKWGEAAQIDMAVEECAELIKAIQKKKRYFEFHADNILDEMVDVEIMLEQLKIIYDYQYSNGAVSKFDDLKRIKLKRLEKRLNGLS